MKKAIFKISLCFSVLMLTVQGYSQTTTKVKDSTAAVTPIIKEGTKVLDSAGTIRDVLKAIPKTLDSTVTKEQKLKNGIKSVDSLATANQKNKFNTISKDSTANMNPVLADTMMANDSVETKQSPWRFGCGFGLNFMGGTNINVSPNLQYALSDEVSLGAGLQANYLYLQDSRKTLTFGLNVLGQYRLGTKITTLLEVAQLKVRSEEQLENSSVKDEFWESALFVGAGYNITNKISVGAKYNMLYDDEDSVFTSAIIPFVNIAF